MKIIKRRWWMGGAIAAVVIAGAVLAWRLLEPHGLPDGIVAGNGRIEAIEIDVAAKTPGRVREILVDEGDLVKAGQIIAHMDTDTLLAQRAEAEARLQEAINAIEISNSQLVQRQSERNAAVAGVRQRETELVAAERRFERSATLAREGATPQQERDDDQASVDSARAALEASKAQVAAAEAAIRTTQAQVVGGRSNVEATRATLRRLDVDIADADLKAPRAGRVQFRVAQPGEVVAAGGRVLNLIDLSDVYMTFFLPEQAAGRVAMGSEARIVLDAAPDAIIPATISFVADVAQFTPKTVETKSERQKLMFRVKAHIPPALLRNHVSQVKIGLPGMAYVRIDPKVAWPTQLAVVAR